eukprot:CAMPEP_0170853180 /NCGR_PEP_ID=MMETSP0734-20130129/12351_1 /TAXON_ID=186038 /ORGANISM="Fragilariopsis kerguelensis, Strain L26-C5" /LENGTH=952 /DNA_ID=CAMNT_0011223793 /DNA_START=1 /DNA_END=2859 /DNA_ORIENTATION=-
MKEESRDYVLQLLDEGRSVLLLSVFMVLPSSISQVGVLYVQFIFPSARSLAAQGKTVEVVSLKYWMLNNLLSSFLSFSWRLWWWIPFSTQIIFAIRCFSTFPSTITHYYSTIEMELITFGILSGESELTVKQTKTVQALRAFVKRLPRDKHAKSFDFEISDDESSDDCDDSSLDSSNNSEKERRRRRRRRRRKERAKKNNLKKKSKKALSDLFAKDIAQSTHNPTEKTQNNSEEQNLEDAASYTSAKNIKIIEEKKNEAAKNSKEKTPTNLTEAKKKDCCEESAADKNYTVNDEVDQDFVDVEIDSTGIELEITMDDTSIVDLLSSVNERKIGSETIQKSKVEREIGSETIQKSKDKLVTEMKQNGGCEEFAVNKFYVKDDNLKTTVSDPLSPMDDEVTHYMLKTLGSVDTSTNLHVSCTENEEKEARDVVMDALSYESDIRHPTSMSIESTGSDMNSDSERTLLPSISKTAGSSESSMIDNCYQSKSDAKQDSSMKKKRSIFVDSKKEEETKDASLNSVSHEIDKPIFSSTDNDISHTLPDQDSYINDGSETLYPSVSMNAIGLTGEVEVSLSKKSRIPFPGRLFMSLDSHSNDDSMIEGAEPFKASDELNNNKILQVDDDISANVSTQSKTTTITEAQHPPTSRRNESNDDVLSLSDIDSVASSTMIEGAESFKASDELNNNKILQIDDDISANASTQSKTTTITEAQHPPTSPRRSTRLRKLQRQEKDHVNRRHTDLTSISLGTSSSKKVMPSSSNRESKKLTSTSDEGSERTCVSYSPSEKSITVSPSKRNKKSSSYPDKKSKKPSPSYSVEVFIDKKVKKSTVSFPIAPKKSTSASLRKTRDNNESSLSKKLPIESTTVSPSRRSKRLVSSSPNKKSKKPSSSTKSTQRMPKKSTSALPINIRSDDQASLPENIQVKSSPNAKRSRKIPNSRKKKKSSPMFGVLNQK